MLRSVHWLHYYDRQALELHTTVFCLPNHHPKRYLNLMSKMLWFAFILAWIALSLIRHVPEVLFEQAVLRDWRTLINKTSLEIDTSTDVLEYYLQYNFIPNCSSRSRFAALWCNVPVLASFCSFLFIELILSMLLGQAGLKILYLRAPLISIW